MHGRPERQALEPTITARLDTLTEMDIAVCQNPRELSELYRRIGDRKFDTFVEIGVANAGTMWTSALHVRPGGLMIGIDCFKNPPKGLNVHREKAERVCAMLRETHEAELIIGRSELVVDDVKARLGGRTIDHLHIDGLHTYEGVKSDFELYSPLVTPGGIIQLHDIISKGTPSEPCGVPRYWKELKQRYPNHWEIIDPVAVVFGIGVIIAS